MNIAEYTYLINKPDAVDDRQIIALEKILQDFPYFQSAKSLHLKGLHKQGSFKYNAALKNTAAFTIDRAILFDLITSETFVGVQRNFYEENEARILEITVIDSTVIEATETEISSLEKSIILSIRESNQDKKEAINSEQKQLSPLEEKLEVGKPLPFTNSETHSFQEWLQLAKIKPIVRTDNPEEVAKNNSVENNLATKLEIIDKFIEANPKIPPIKKEASTPLITIKTEDHSYLMTETLAKVYLEQKKYSKAIQAYEILILKYPEKITFFADRISDIKTLQQNNNS